MTNVNVISLTFPKRFEFFCIFKTFPGSEKMPCHFPGFPGPYEPCTPSPNEIKTMIPLQLSVSTTHRNSELGPVVGKEVQPPQRLNLNSELTY